MRYQLAPLHCRPWLLNGLSQKLIESHYENNYGGALRRLNAVTTALESLDPEKAPPYVLAGLKRDQHTALNSTLLHELYFASLAEGGKPSEAMAAALARDFGSLERWRAEFVALGNALAGGSGWVLLTWVPRDGRLVNQIATDHAQSIAGGVPILALDMYEHAYHIDFGANARAYVDAFMRHLDWASVEARFGDATAASPPRPLVQPEFEGIPGISPEQVKARLEAGEPLQVIDARPRHYFSRTSEIMEGAVWRDPERVSDWIGELSKDEPVVVFCAYGFHIGCRTTAALRDAGFEAAYMLGGHSAWKALGGGTRLATAAAPQKTMQTV